MVQAHTIAKASLTNKFKNQDAYTRRGGRQYWIWCTCFNFGWHVGSLRLVFLNTDRLQSFRERWNSSVYFNLFDYSACFRPYWHVPLFILYWIDFPIRAGTVTARQLHQFMSLWLSVVLLIRDNFNLIRNVGNHL